MTAGINSFLAPWIGGVGQVTTSPSTAPAPPPGGPCQTPVLSDRYCFNPSLGELVLNAYSRIGIRRTSILAGHLADARIEANLLQAEWNNRQVNLWTVDLESVALTLGTGTYDVDDSTVMILDAYITTGGLDYIIFPISRTEYASIPNKTTRGRPSQFWFDRLTNSDITLWPVPDANATYTLNYYRCRLIQDAALEDGGNVEIPQLWLDCFAAGLAFRLARIYAPQMRLDRKAEYDEAWNIAATQNVENVPLSIIPGVAGYFR